MPRIVGYASDLTDLAHLFADRRKALGIPQRALDDAAGLQDGYVSKVECGTRRLGHISLPVLLSALGLRLIVVEAGEPLPASVAALVGSRQARCATPPRIATAEAA